MRSKSLASFAAAALLCGVSLSSLSNAAFAAEPAIHFIPATSMGTWGFDAPGMDTKVKPGDDFYAYANGTYTSKLEIPADKSSYGAFNALRDLSEKRLQGIIDDLAAAKDLPAGSEEAKIGVFYSTFMDEAHIESLGGKPVAPALAKIKAIKSKAALVKFSADPSQSFGVNLLDYGVSPDFKDPGVNRLFAGQSGLGMPDRDYYLKDSFKDKKALYLAYVEQILTMSKWPNAKKAAKDIVDFETKVAEAHWSKVEERDPVKGYNPMSVKEYYALTAGYPSEVALTTAGLEHVQKIIVGEKSAFPKLAKIFADTPLATLKAWEAFHVVDDAAPYMSKAYVDAHWAFHSKGLSGTKEQRPRWKRAVASTEGALGEALGKVYVGAYFPPESKAKMVALVSNLRVALKARLENLTWMGPETKAKALEKLANFTVKIGYPDKWRDYSGLTVVQGDLVGNIERSKKFEQDHDFAKIDKPVDRSEWGMYPQTVNAYYNPLWNEIVFPAAILQPPFFDPKADDAVNYGAIGGVIGHEIGHGFDDEGRQFDAHGVLTDWWTADDAAKFKVQTTKLAAQYNAYEPLPGVHVNGDLTMGENIGDYGGVTFALDAYHLSLHGQPAPVIDGFTGDQRFFLGWAQVWRTKIRDEAVKQQVTTDPHSPGYFRALAPLRNLDAWYTAFDVKPGDKYYVKPEDRVRIW